MREQKLKMLFNEISILKCKNDDYRFVHDLSKRNMEHYVKKHWGGWDSKIFSDSFNQNNIKIVKYKKRKVGFYDTAIDGNEMYLKNIQITSMLRGKGVGAFLMKKIEKEAKNKKIEKIKLRTFKDNPANRFFSKEGYGVVGSDESSIVIEKNFIN